MKQNIIPIIVIALAFTSQTLRAGPITDTYTTGDTLTTTTLGNIKAAVNDNDSRIIDNQNATTTNQSAIANNKSVAAIDRTTYYATDVENITKTVSTVTSVSLDVPSAGKVIVSFSGVYSISHTTGTGDMLCIEIELNPAASPFPRCDGELDIVFQMDPSHRLVSIHPDDPSSGASGNIHTQQVFSVPGAGSYTYYLRGQSNTEGTNIRLRQSNMIVYFVAD